MKTETVKLDQIRLNDRNPRVIYDDKFEKLVNSILVFPKMLELRPVVVDDTVKSIGGNMRFKALCQISGLSIEEIRRKLSTLRDFNKKEPGEQNILIDYWAKWKIKPTVPIIRASDLTEDEKRQFIIKDNVGYGEWDHDILANEWDAEDLDDWGVSVWQDDDGDLGAVSAGGDEPQNGTLQDRFVVPPFSILDTRKGYWQARKKIWRELIGDMGESRSNTLITSPEIKYKDLYQKTRKHREELGISFPEYLEKHVSDEIKEREAGKILAQGVSILDPVLAEIVCLWFGVDKGQTFDCFAGDTVFGYVSALLGNEFTGIEFREEQAALNNERVADMKARYICDDGQNVGKHIEPQSQDLLFSCPPYFDLEVYSDKENDASNQPSYEAFIQILSNAFRSAINCLKDDRFAVITVGDVRNKKNGFYYDFAGDIKHIFSENGMLLYNELILIETGASTALRAAKYMDSRKVAKMHQQVLVFYKGDPKNIKSNFKKIEYDSEDLELFRVDSGDGPAEA